MRHQGVGVAVGLEFQPVSEAAEVVFHHGGLSDVDFEFAGQEDGNVTLGDGLGVVRGTMRRTAPSWSFRTTVVMVPQGVAAVGYWTGARLRKTVLPVVWAASLAQRSAPGSQRTGA
jgi:hypothetical protein